MAHSNRIISESFIASGDLSTSQFHIVHIVGAFNVANALVNVGFGVLQNKPLDTEHATVAVNGATKVAAGASVSVGDLITSAGSGFAVAITSGNALDKAVLGRALTAAASGSVFTMEIDRFIVVRTGGLV